MFDPLCRVGCAVRVSLKQQRILASNARADVLGFYHRASEELGLQAPDRIPTGPYLAPKILALSQILETRIGKTLSASVADGQEFAAGALWHWVVWAELGFPAFELSQGLTASLLLTEPMPKTEFHLPFESLVICLPPEIPIAFELGDRIEHASSIAACELPAWKSAEELQRFRSATNALDATKILLSAGLSNKLYTHITGDSGGLFHFTDPWNLVGSESWLNSLHESDVTHQLPSDIAANKLKNRLLSNLFDYIESDHGAAEFAAQASKVARRDAKTMRLGSTINLPAPGKFLRSLGDETSWKLEHRYIVRGHWRLQPHGPERSLRKRIWIMPFWKGPDDAVAVSERIYRVEEKTP
jgi:hypothetical protein